MRDPGESTPPDPPDDGVRTWGSAGSSRAEPASGPERPSDRVRIPPELRYELRGVVGTGGIGRVLAAHDRRLGRVVAFKELHRRAAARLADRFAQEAAITAILEHPGIVPLYDCGTSSDGTPYYTMRFIAGRSLADTLRDRDLRDRLALLRHFLDVCEAMAYAHSQGVIHRDLKPSNVMVGAYGETLVVDWGLAKIVGAPEAEDRASLLDQLKQSAGQTMIGSVVGTPAYMSPEQARGQAADERSDVWSLGAILYEILTGGPPFFGETATEVVRAVAIGEAPPVAGREPRAPPELASITHRALAVDPAQRYRDAAALAADVAAWLEGARVDAHAYTIREAALRRLRRYRVPLAAAAAAGAVGLVAAALSYRNALTERNRAIAASHQAEQAEERANGHLAAALRDNARNAIDAGARPEAEVLAAHALRLREDPIARGVLARTFVTERPRPAARRALPADCPHPRLSPAGDAVLCVTDAGVRVEDLIHGAARWATTSHLPGHELEAIALGSRFAITHARFGPYGILDAASGAQVGELWAPPDSDVSVALTVDDAGAVGISEDSRQAWILDFAHRTLRSLDPCGDAAYPAVDVSESGERFALMCGDGRLVVGAVAAPDEASTVSLPLTGDRGIVRISVIDGDPRVLVGGWRGGLTVVDPTSGALAELEPHADRVSGLGWSTLGLFTTFGDDSRVGLVDVVSGSAVGWLPAQAGLPARFVGDRLATMSKTALTLWDLPSPRRPWVRYQDSGVSGICVSPDGALVGAATGNASLVVTRTRDGARVATETWHDAVVKSCAFSPDGRGLLVSASKLDVVRIFDPTTWKAVSPEQGGTSYARVTWGASGAHALGAAYVPAALDVWSAADGTRIARIPVPTGRRLLDAAATPDGRVVVFADETGQVWRYRADPEPTLEAVLGVQAGRPALSADGRRLATALGAEVSVRDAGTGAEERAFTVTDEVRAVALDPGGERLAVGYVDGTVEVWEVNRAHRLGILSGHLQRVSALQFSPDGTWLYSASWDADLRTWAMAPLGADPDALVEQVESAWELDLDAAMAASAFRPRSRR